MLGQASVPVTELACERFLYAPVCEQQNGTQVTVLSALVRANIDPWEEAVRLTRMPRAKAEATLSSILRQSSDQNWTGPEVEAVSARLIQLLPRKDGGDSTTSDSTTIVELDRSIFWLVWLGFALAVSLNSPRSPTTISEPGPAVTSPAALSSAAGTVADKEQ